MNNQIGDLYKCQQCSGTFARQNALNRHIKSVHESQRYKCPLKSCSKEFKRIDTLERHMDVHKNVKYTCPYDDCKASFSREDYRDKHLAQIHKEEKYKCDKCGLVCLSQLELHRHNKAEHEPIKCKDCGKVFKTKSQRDIHYDNVHANIKKFVCKHCDEKFKSNEVLTSHILRNHSEQGAIYNCEHCDRSFYSEADRTRHHKVFHKDNDRFKCDQCEKTFCFGSQLTRHKNESHLKLRQYTCKECGDSFIKSGHLNAHCERKHVGLKEKCHYSECNELLHPADLKQHIKRVHLKQRDYKCNYIIKSDRHDQSLCCGKHFFSLKELRLHIKCVHHKIKEIPCDQCPAHFSSKQILQSHIAHIHNTERPHECEECPSKFKTKHGLHMHKKLCHDPKYLGGRVKREEKRVSELLQEHGIKFTPEYGISFGKIGDTEKKSARIDFWIEREDGIILLEVDERQHKFSIDGVFAPICDVARMEAVRHALLLENELRPIFWIRYNPNKFRVDNELQNVPRSTREKRLIDLIQNASFGQPLELAYMYYDCLDDELLNHSSPDYDPYYREICHPPIIGGT